MIGKPRGEILGGRIWDLVPAIAGSQLEAALRRAVAERISVCVEYFYPPFSAWFENRIYPSEDGLTVYFQDITERKRAEEERARLLADEQAARTRADAARERLMFLAQVGDSLFKSIDYRRTLRRVAELAVAQLADWCIVDVLDEGGTLGRVAVACADRASKPSISEFRRKSGARVQLPRLPSDFRAGQAHASSDVPRSLLEALGWDEAELQFVAGLRPRSSVVVPLLARAKFLGCITLLMTESGHQFDADDLQLASAVGWRIAMAIDTAQLVDDQRRIIGRLEQVHEQLQAAERERLLEQERARLARELHDRVAQTFFSIKLTSDNLLQEATAGSTLTREVLEELHPLAARGADELRAAIFALHTADATSQPPEELLDVLVRDFERQHGIPAELVVSGRKRSIPAELVDVLHAVAREALANVARHAHAQAVMVGLTYARSCVNLTIQDDGAGAAAPGLPAVMRDPTHFGLRSLRERLERVGGSLVARPGDSGGFVVRARVPLAAAQKKYARIDAVTQTDQMVVTIREGECVRLPDGRIGRVRKRSGNSCTIRVRRTTSKTHQFVDVSVTDLEVVDCPEGWMSPAGYNRYLAATLAKMRERNAMRHPIRVPDR